jgi:adenylate cyclase
MGIERKFLVSTPPGDLEHHRSRIIEHWIPAGDRMIELDVYEGPLAGLVTAEVEFPSERDGSAFEPPAWFGEEVTDDDRYKNEALAREGIPD